MSESPDLSPDPSPDASPSDGAELGADCPFCGAPAGAPCRTASGRVAARTHADRPVAAAGFEPVGPPTPAVPPPAVPTTVGWRAPDTTGPIARPAAATDEPVPLQLVERRAAWRTDVAELTVDVVRLVSLVLVVVVLLVVANIVTG